MNGIVRSPYRTAAPGGGSSNGYLAADIPSASMRKTTNVAQGTALSTNTPAKTTITTTATRLNMFTMPSGNTLKSSSVDPFYAVIEGHISGAVSAGAGAIFRHNLYKNGSVIEAQEYNSMGICTTWNTTGGLKSFPLYAKTLIELDDEIEIWTTDIYDPDDWDTWSMALGITFDGWA